MSVLTDLKSNMSILWMFWTAPSSYCHPTAMLYSFAENIKLHWWYFQKGANHERKEKQLSISNTIDFPSWSASELNDDQSMFIDYTEFSNSATGPCNHFQPSDLIKCSACIWSTERRFEETFDGLFYMTLKDICPTWNEDHHANKMLLITKYSRNTQIYTESVSVSTLKLKKCINQYITR